MIEFTSLARRGVAAVIPGVVVLLAAALGRPVAAAPLDLSAVSADAVWLMHMDMDAARASTVMQRMHDRAMKMHPQLDTMLKMGAGMTGIDPRKDVRDMTAWGTDTDKKNGVLVVRSKVNRQLLEKMVEKAQDHRTMEHRGRTVHSWMQRHGRNRTGEPVSGAFFADDVMVFARTPERVAMAIDVLDGAKPSAGDGSPLAGRVRPGSILVARAAEVDPDTKCPVLRQGRSFRVAMGENEGKSFYRAKLDMKSPAAADLAEDVTEGLAAVGQLRFGGEADVMKLIAGLETETRDGSCMISWDAAADDVWAVVDRMATQWERRHRDRGGKGCPMCEKDGCDGCGGCPLGKGDGGKPAADRPLRDDEF